jgi:hypothetical protein
MLFRAGVGDRRDDVLGAQRLQILDGHRASVGAVLGGHPRIPQTIGALDDVAGEPAVLHDVNSVGAIRRQVGPQRLTGHVQRFACGGLDDGRARCP